MVQSLGFAVYRALDWGLDENEERELSPRLEQLIDLMTNSDSEDSGCATADEGYGGQDEEEEGGEGPPRSVRTFGQAMRCCAARLADPAGAPAHYQAVCRALFAETVELMAFLAKIRDAKEVSVGARWHHGPAGETTCSDKGLGTLLCPLCRSQPRLMVPLFGLSQTAMLAGNQELGCISVLQPPGTVLAGPSVPPEQGDSILCLNSYCRS